jgi:hypothetical protein
MTYLQVTPIAYASVTGALRAAVGDLGRQRIADWTWTILAGENLLLLAGV